MIVEPAPAKLNLALHVRSRRPDGYHELETIFAFAAEGDVLSVVPAGAWSLALTGPFAVGLSAGADNLVTRAAHAFADRFGGGTAFAVTLDKRLPVASGIGGGSADAAAMLRVLARLRGVAIDDPTLMACAADLGADVPACVLGRAAVGRGRGERLVPLTGLGGQPALLVNPGVALSTGAVFAGWDGVDHGPLPDGDALAVARTGRNDLQPAASALAPVIADVLDALTGPEVVLARMSGSGATCFALCDHAAARDRLAQRLKAHHPEWWTLATTVD
ncbi:MAG: 4-(cytidine 5'-diphospho)-2-C-methyl-D-erythritol kinase [Pseudomonadota bacterium]